MARQGLTRLPLPRPQSHLQAQRLFSCTRLMRRTTGPSWLDGIPQSPSKGPKLYAWTTENLPRTDGPVGSETAAPKATSQQTTSERISILGIGNLGRLYAASLSQIPDAPRISLIVHRKALLEHWARNPGIEMTRSGVVETSTKYDVAWWTPEKPAAGPIREVCDGGTISNLIVATKAPDALAQADKLRRYLSPESTVAFVQNGVNRLWPPHGAEYSLRRFGARGHPNWLACVTTHGVKNLGPFRSVHASPADVAMGAILLNPETRGKADYLMERIAAAPHLNAHRLPRATLWVKQLEKLVVNSIINPLTAILRCKNGVLFSDPGGEMERVMDLLLEEASRVLQALVRDDSTREIMQEAEPDKMPGVTREDSDLEQKQVALVERFSNPQLRQMLYRVGEVVAENTSSMLQDVEAGKETEIAEFNGWLLDTAARLGNLDLVNHARLKGLVERGLVLDPTRLRREFPHDDNV